MGQADQEGRADPKADQVGRIPRRTVAARVDLAVLKVDLATAAVALQAGPEARTTGQADREAQVGPATGAMGLVAQVGRTGVPHPRTSPGVGWIRVDTTTSRSTTTAAGCSRSSTPTSTTGASGSSASGFRCDGLAGLSDDVRPVMATSPAAFRCLRDSDIAALFLFGGLARLLSIAISGPPNAFYSAMLVIELAMPFALFFATSRLPR